MLTRNKLCSKVKQRVQDTIDFLQEDVLAGKDVVIRDVDV